MYRYQASLGEGSMIDFVVISSDLLGPVCLTLVGAELITTW